MKLLIKSVEELQKYIRINKSADFTTYRTFIVDAQVKYIHRFFNEELIEVLEDTDPLFELICRSLAPFSMAMSTDEFSINFGESGHTVTRTVNNAPASDAKIDRAKSSLFERGWDNLDKALQYAIDKKDEYQNWTKIDESKTKLYSSAREFQDKGMVDIGYSFLTFYHLRLLIQRIEKTETFMLLPSDLRIQYESELIPEKLLSAMQAYTGSRVASLHTSINTRSQRAHPGNAISAKAEFKPVIRPLYEDLSETGNYFEIQVDFWKNQISETLIEMDKIEPDASTLKWNSADRRIFVAGAKRS